MTDTAPTEIELKRKFTLDDLREWPFATVTMAQAADVYGISAQTYSDAFARGEVPGLKIGRRVVVPKEQLLELIERKNRAESA